MHSFPWNAVLLGQDEQTKYPMLDRTAGADDLRLWIKALMTDGVYLADADAFNVTPSEGMKVLVSPGMCIINGTPGIEPNTRELALQASASQDRIDTIVIRWDDNRDVRDMDLYVKTGVASDVPVRPTLTRTETIYELGICDIYIPANSTSVTQERMTDTRLESERCGMVTAILEIDTTTFFNQLQTATDKAVELADSALDGTIAGNLQNQIDDKISKDDLEDYILAEGDSGIWHWVKYASGWAECWGKENKTLSISSLSNTQNIRVTSCIIPSLPFQFSEIKDFVSTPEVHSNDYLWNGSLYYNSTLDRYTVFFLTISTSSVSLNANIYNHVSGMWK